MAARIKGRKIGLTSRAMQLASQITEPDYAPLMDDMFFETGSDIPIDPLHRAACGRWSWPSSLGKPLQGPGVTLFDVLSRHRLRHARPSRSSTHASSSSTATPAVMRKVFDTISDFAANAGIVLGGRPGRADCDVDLRWVGALLHKNGVIEETGLAAAVLNHPATGVAWLADKIAPVRRAARTRATCVLAGSSTRPTPAVQGDTVHADYGPLGSCFLPLSFETGPPCIDPDPQPCSQRALQQRPDCDSALRAWASAGDHMPPRRWPAAASTGCCWTASTAPNDVRAGAGRSCAPWRLTRRSPVVRPVDGRTRRWLKQYLDIGAQTLLIPMIDSAGTGRADGARHALRRPRACVAWARPWPAPHAGTRSWTTT